MTIRDLENVEDKMEVFRNIEVLRQYGIIKVKDLIEAIILYLDDSQKIEVLNYYKLEKGNKFDIVRTITDEKIKMQILQDNKLMEDLFNNFYFSEFLGILNDEFKIYVLNNVELLKKFDIDTDKIKKIIIEMLDEKKQDIVSNKEFMEKIGLSQYEIIDLIISIKDDEIKDSVSQKYELDEEEKIKIIKSFSTNRKERIIFEDNKGLENKDIEEIISSFEPSEVIDFINNNKSFLIDREIKLARIISSMAKEKQLEIVYKIDEIDMTEGEKRKCYAILNNETKQEIDVEKVPKKYRELIMMRKSEEFKSLDKIIPDLSKDMTLYKDLDEYLYINPLNILNTEEDRKNILKLCKICPNAEIKDNFMLSSSSVEEFIKGEEWIEFILQGIDVEWTDIQKLAYIDTMIGKKISYSPEFETEVTNNEDIRALWKIITSGYGVCNGIVQIEQYLLSRIGIESEEVSGKRHAFLKVKNIEIPTESGVAKGDTLTDPTWNLTSSRYGTYPEHFCLSYEELRKVDITKDGRDCKCHKNKGLESEKLINLEEKFLRDVYKSIGLTDKDGNFQAKEFIEKSEKINKESNDIKSNIKSKFELLKQWCPEFATCQDSTMDILKLILLSENEHFKYKKCIAERVYNKSDQDKKAVLYVYVESEDSEKMFFYADKEVGEFIQLSQNEFETKFECYESDLVNGRRAWETEEIKKEDKTNSSQQTVEEGR